MTRIFLNNNIFDFLYDRKIDLLKEFPKAQFKICVPKEVKFESECIKDKDFDKKNYVDELFKNRIVLTHSYFGFYDDTHICNFQRIGGFDNGKLKTENEIKLSEELNSRFLKNTNKKHPQHDLYKNEGDIALAVRSVENIVLTNDRKSSNSSKQGPLNYAYDKGCRIVFLNKTVELI